MKKILHFMLTLQAFTRARAQKHTMVLLQDFREPLTVISVISRAMQR